MANDKNKEFEKNIEMGKEKALENALRGIEKEFGKGAIMKLGEAAAQMNVEVIPTGCLPIDMALGVDGVPRGRVIEIFGPESSGKTTVALHIIEKRRKWTALLCSLTLNMHLTRPTRKGWALI
jgi:recombination protein RecA